MTERWLVYIADENGFLIGVRIMDDGSLKLQKYSGLDDAQITEKALAAMHTYEPLIAPGKI